MFDALGSLAGPLAYLAVAGLAALEASAFVGLFVPGELALVTGGYIAHRGNADLRLMMLLATAGAIVGDSVGYEIGRRFGPAVQRSRLGRRVGDERWARAHRYLEERGGRAVFAGRFVGVLRALVPAVAGGARMPYRRFLAWNVLGAVLWAPGLVLAGYLAGSSYRRVAAYAGPAGLVLLGGLVVAAGLGVAARWVARHPDEVRAATTRVLARPPVVRLTRRYEAQLTFFAARFRPGNALGLALTVQLAVLAAAGWAFGVLLQDVVIGRDAARLDLPILHYLVDHRTPWLTTTLQAVTQLGSSAVLGPMVAVLAVVAFRRTRRWLVVAQLGLPLVGAILLYDLVKPLVGRPRPHVGHLVSTATGYSFPSGHATQTAAVAFTLAFVAAGLTPSWPRKVALWATAAGGSLAIGFSRVYLGVHWPTDVLAGFALGALWAAICAVALGTNRLRDATTAEGQAPAATST